MRFCVILLGIWAFSLSLIGCSSNNELTGSLASGILNQATINDPDDQTPQTQTPQMPSPMRPEEPNVFDYVFEYKFTTGALVGKVRGVDNSQLLKFQRNDNGQTLARFTNQSGMLVKAPAGAPRFDYFAGLIKGLRVEKESRNLLLEEFGTWPMGENTGLYPTREMGPDGQLSAARVSYFPAGGSYLLSTAANVGTGNLVVGSIFVKGAYPNHKLKIYMTNTDAVPLLVLLDHTRFVRYQMYGVAKSDQVFMRLENENENGMDTDLEMLVWGAQIELGTVASTPIDYGKTRARDELRMDDLSWFNQKQGVFVFSAETPAAISANKQVLFSLTKGEGATVGSPADGLYVVNVAGATSIEVVKNSIAVATSSSAVTWTPNKNVKLAVAYNETSITIYENGVLSFKSNHVIPTGLTRLNIGYSDGFAYKGYLEAHVSEFRYSNDVVTEAELAALSK